MKKETTAKAPSIEEAVERAARELGCNREDCGYEVLEEPKKKSLFSRQRDALVRVWAEIAEPVTDVRSAVPVPAPAPTPAPVLREIGNEQHALGAHPKLAAAKQYLQAILSAMELDNVRIQAEETEEGATLTFEGEGVAVLIGHHGETLDALQYLVALTCNRIDGDYYRITLDCGSYREKREATLRALASRIANKVKKSGRSQLLEPMNPYERRIIHAVVSEIDGVYSKSRGEEPNRRVVILSETPAKSSRPPKDRGGREEYRKKSSYPPKREPTMEEILKGNLKEKTDGAALYSKIEL